MINVYFLQHRRNFIPILEYFTKRIKPENKKLLKVHFLLTDNIQVEFNTGIDYEVHHYGGNMHTNNYRSKFLWALEQDCEYFFKLDEDIILSNHVWDYMIENRHLASNPHVMTVSPTINIGVPSVDLFIESFCPERKEEIESLFLKVDIQKTAGQRWGMDLEHLNDFTIRADKWEPYKFHERLTSMDTNIKGIHPVRFDDTIQTTLMDIVLKNVHKFISPGEFYPVTINCPYFVNDLCLYETKKIRQAEKDMGFDPYDEIPMNKWAFDNQLSHVYIKNAYSVHTFYAFVSGAQRPNEEHSIHNYILEKAREIHHFDLI